MTGGKKQEIYLKIFFLRFYLRGGRESEPGEGKERRRENLKHTPY